MKIWMTFLSGMQIFKDKAEILDHAKLQWFASGAATFLIHKMRKYPVRDESAWCA